VPEFLEELEGLVAGLFEEGGQAQPRLTAALAPAACRVCYLDAAARIMAGEGAESFFDAHRARVARAFDQAAIAAVAIEWWASIALCTPIFSTRSALWSWPPAR
jgi:hypothetical protein